MHYKDIKMYFKEVPSVDSNGSKLFSVSLYINNKLYKNCFNRKIALVNLNSTNSFDGILKNIYEIECTQVIGQTEIHYQTSRNVLH